MCTGVLQEGHRGGEKKSRSSAPPSRTVKALEISFWVLRTPLSLKNTRGLYKIFQNPGDNKNNVKHKQLFGIALGTGGGLMYPCVAFFVGKEGHI